jgi:hypothetical protein
MRFTEYFYWILSVGFKEGKNGKKPRAHAELMAAF